MSFERIPYILYMKNLYVYAQNYLQTLVYITIVYFDDYYIIIVYKYNTKNVLLYDRRLLNISKVIFCN